MSENWIFFKKWLNHPLRLGTFLPCQKRFSKNSIRALLQKHAFPKHLHQVKVLELGAGTGRFTQALLDAGFTDITSIEIDPDLNRFMHDRFGSKVIILNMDAAEIAQHFEEEHFDLVVSVLPLMYINHTTRQKIVDESFKVLKKDGIFWHACYTPSQSWFQLDDIAAEKVLTQWTHFPTGFVYEFKKIA